MFQFVVFLWLCTFCEAKDKVHSLDKDALLKAGTDVWFESLSEYELREHWSEDDESSLSERKQQLARFDFEVFVNVKLVGFSQAFFGQAKADLLRYLDNSPITRFQTAHILHTSGEETHDLPVRTNFVYDVEIAPLPLQQKLTSVLETYAAQHKTGDVHSIDPEIVEQELRDDFTRGLPKHTLYVLNLPELKAGGSSNYSYVPHTEQVEGLFNVDAPTVCSSPHWVSAAARFAWLDLAAGPVFYGPHFSGEGFVSTEHTLPSLSRVVKASQAKGKAAKDMLRSRVHEFFASLAAFVHVSMQQLVSPSLHSFPVPWANLTIVDVVFIHDVEDGESDVARAARHNSIWASALQQLKDLTIAGNRVEVRIQHVKMEDCEVCAVAFARALRTTSSKVAVEGLRTPIQEYLSSEKLVESLASFQSSTKLPSHGRRVPVYVFNLGLEEAVLIDRTLQAKTTDGVVVAVQSVGERVALDSQCNSKRLEFDPRTAARPALAAVLQTLGVASTDQIWNRHTQRIETNYLWSIGHTPFGGFSANSALSFAQKDAVTRNVLISEISQVLIGLREVMEEFSHFGMELDAALSQQSYLAFVRRWNLLRFKLERAQKTASLMDYQKALIYVRSMSHDFDGVKALIASAELTARFGGKVFVSQSRLPRASSWTWLHVFELVIYLGLTCFCIWTLIDPHNFVVTCMRDLVVKKKRL